MHILMTGGTGLIGRALARALTTAGHELTVLSRKPASVAEKCGEGVNALASLDEWGPDRYFEAIINLAGEPIVDVRWTPSRKQALWDSRVTLTEALVKRIAAADRKPSVLLSGSAIGYYGDRGDAGLDEDAGVGADFGAELCRAWEAAALVAVDLGVRVALLRTGLVLSAEGGMLARMLPSFKLGLGARIGDGRQLMSWIHIDDYVAMVLRLLDDATLAGPVNMTAPHPVTNAEFTACLSRVLRRPAWFMAPACLLRASLGERAVLLLGGQKALPSKLEAQGFAFRYPRLEEALRALLGG